eukprot:3408428-Pleurochrysis_carterae.AAC.1
MLRRFVEPLIILESVAHEYAPPPQTSLIHLLIKLNVNALLDVDRRRRARSLPSTARNASYDVLYIRMILISNFWGCDLMEVIESRQLFHDYVGLLVREAIGIESRHIGFVPGEG